MLACQPLMKVAIWGEWTVRSLWALTPERKKWSVQVNLQAC